MSQKDIETFFDKLASRWDAMEIKKDEDILPLLKEIGIKQGDKILDVGCGTGRITSLLHSFGHFPMLFFLIFGHFPTFLFNSEKILIWT